MSKINFFYRCILIASLGGLIFGYDTGVISGALLFIKKEFGLSTWQSEILVSSALFGAMIGALVCALLMNNWGRRATIFCSALFFAVGSLGCWLASSWLALIFFRSLVGFGIGISSYITPLYIAEISLAYRRGGFVGFNTIAVTGGIVLAYLINNLLVFTQSWRLMLGLGTILALLLIVGCFFLPESVRWLIKKKSHTQALAILMKLHQSPAKAQAEYQHIADHIEQFNPSWREVLRPKYRKVLFMGLALALIQQFSGINAILYYAPWLFEQLHWTELSSFRTTLTIGCINFLMTIVALFWVDKFGRRWLMLRGLAVMVVSLFVLGWSLSYNTLQPFLAIGSIFTFIAAYALSIGCLFWIIIAELYPLNLRNLVMGLASSMHWAANLAISLVFLSILNYLGPARTFWMFGGFMLAGWFYCWAFLPETTGLTLEEIEQSMMSYAKS